MTIDEGVKNLEYGTKQLEMELESGLWIKGSESELCCKEGIALNKKCIEWLTELKEAKRLLKAAVSELNNGTCVKFCSACANVNTSKCQDYKKKKYIWVHTDEALKLIGDNNR